MAQPGINVESCPGCMLLLWLISEACQTFQIAWVAFKWLHIALPYSQLAVIRHMTGWWVCPWLCVICGGKNGINGCQLAIFSEDVASLCQPVCGYPSTLPSYMSASCFGYTSKKLSTMAGNSASYPLNSWWIDIL